MFKRKWKRKGGEPARRPPPPRPMLSACETPCSAPLFCSAIRDYHRDHRCATWSTCARRGFFWSRWCFSLAWVGLTGECFCRQIWAFSLVLSPGSVSQMTWEGIRLSFGYDLCLGCLDLTDLPLVFAWVCRGRCVGRISAIVNYLPHHCSSAHWLGKFL